MIAISGHHKFSFETTYPTYDVAPIQKLVLQPDTIVHFAEFYLILLYAIVQIQ